MRFADRAHLKRFPFSATPPRILNIYPKIDVFDFVFHRQHEVVLAIERARNERNATTRNKFANKNNAAPPGIGLFSPHVKTQIHFLEIAMPWNGQTKQARVEK